MSNMKGRIILITGAAGCLGRIAALECASQGAEVILLDKTVAGLEKVYDEIVAQGGPEPAIYPFDLAGANEAEYQELATTIEQTFGVLHGLLHNAAELDALTPITCSSSQQWNQTLNINLNAPYLLTRLLLPLLEQTGDAAIVFTSDSVARQGRAYWGAYGVAKIALEGLAHTLAEEMDAQGIIRVNILVPGAVNSPLRERAYAGEAASERQAPESLARLYRYLFGSASQAENGKTYFAEQFNQEQIR